MDAGSETLIALSIQEGCDQTDTVTVPTIGFYHCDDGRDASSNIAPTIRSMKGGGVGGPAVASGQGSVMAVRRLLPVECCRLQGFSDDFFDGVIYNGKTPADGPMYKALGNSMAVPVLSWIGDRILKQDEK